MHVYSGKKKKCTHTAHGRAHTHTSVCVYTVCTHTQYTHTQTFGCFIANRPCCPRTQNFFSLNRIDRMCSLQIGVHVAAHAAVQNQDLAFSLHTHAHRPSMLATLQNVFSNTMECVLYSDMCSIVIVMCALQWRTLPCKKGLRCTYTRHPCSQNVFSLLERVLYGQNLFSIDRMCSLYIECVVSSTMVSSLCPRSTKPPFLSAVS